jgi:D-tyrosyl-tRNA(Tyr) deacylase
MLALIQLVKHASVKVDGQIIANIDDGILALIGLEKTDTPSQGEKLIERILNYRIFPDANGKMNLSLKDVKGALLLVPQFTLVAETQKGTRPGFSKGMQPAEGKILFDHLTTYAKTQQDTVQTGQFGAYMQVSLCNDGPATFLLHAN